MSEKNRYSDAELQEFKELIQGKIEEAKKDLDLLQGQISHKGDNSGSDTSAKFNMMEDGNEAMAKEEMGSLAHRQSKFIKHLQNALIRIENKTYGVCRQTGKLISKERLRAVPHATLSIDAKMNRKEKD